jgi:carbon monoxide dehydrogenase subunit G
MNPETLARALPGCEKVESNTDGSFQARMQVAVGAVKGTYQARIEILDPNPPERYRMKVDGKGTNGFIKGEGTITLSGDTGRTHVAYTGDAQVGGVIASAGQRLIHAAAKQIVTQFFEAFSHEVHSP